MKARNSPKRFVVGGGASPQSLATNPSSKSLRSPKVVTTNKIRRMNKNVEKPPAVAAKKQEPSKPVKANFGTSVRNNFKSPAAVRKPDLIQKENNKDLLRKNVSASRANRRTRKERKDKVLDDSANPQPEVVRPPVQQKSKYDDVNIPVNIFDTRHELVKTIGHDIFEIECPRPAPAPERFDQIGENDFGDFNHRMSHLEVKPDMDDLPIADEETD